MRSHRLGIAFLFTLLVALSAAADGPASLRNDASCDISVAPAATLLLPYFEVALEDWLGETTLFTVTNVTDVERIARVTLWTDWSYPVITFNLYLTGYDTQSVNLRDVLTGYAFAPPFGTGTSVSHTGDRSGPNYRLDVSNCGLIPPRLDSSAVARMQDAFTEGQIAGVCDALGTSHENAVGYATIDVVANCTSNGPHDAEYFTRDIRYDNVLIGDYQQINSAQDFAQGNPMVHIRAIPEGRTPRTRSVIPTRFDRTFYGRLQPADRPLLDARQPLPSTFAARWINGGTGNFQTWLKIWRQGVTNASANCAVYDDNDRIFVESIAFDEHANGEGMMPESCEVTCIGDERPRLPSTALVEVQSGSEAFPQSILSTTVSGWIYINLEDDAQTDGAPQGWVVTSMRAEGRYSVDFDAAWLGNGCSPTAPITSYSNPALPQVGNATQPTPRNAILPGPAPDVNP